MSIYSHKNSRSQKSKSNLLNRSNQPSPLEPQWIGQDFSTSEPSVDKKEMSERKPPHKLSINKDNQPKTLPVGNKSPVELMQDILRMVG